MHHYNFRRHPNNKRNNTTEEIILAVSFVTVFALLLVPFENDVVSGSPVPTVVFRGRASYFHAFVLGLNFAFFGAFVTIFLREMSPKVATYARLLSVVSMAVAVFVFSWLALPLLFKGLGF